MLLAANVHAILYRRCWLQPAKTLTTFKVMPPAAIIFSGSALLRIMRCLSSNFSRYFTSVLMLCKSDNTIIEILTHFMRTITSFTHALAGHFSYLGYWKAL